MTVEKSVVGLGRREWVAEVELRIEQTVCG